MTATAIKTTMIQMIAATLATIHSANVKKNATMIAKSIKKFATIAGARVIEAMPSV